jgi:predicted nucleic acid-binding protein
MTRNAARHRRLNISLADGFAIATAQARGASLASFDHRVRRALAVVGVGLAAELA